MFKGLPELIDVCSCVLFHLTSRLMLGIIWGYVDVFLSSFFPLRGGGEPGQRSNQVLFHGEGCGFQTLVTLVIRAPSLSEGCVKTPSRSEGCAVLTPTQSVGCAASRVLAYQVTRRFHTSSIQLPQKWPILCVWFLDILSVNWLLV